jgi:hypothetical protein
MASAAHRCTAEHRLRITGLEQCSATGVPPQGLWCAAKCYKKLYIRTSKLDKCNILSFVIRIRNTHTHIHWFIIDRFIQHACILIGQGFICRYIFMAIYSFAHPFRETGFCGVPSCVFDKLGCVADEVSLRNADLERTSPTNRARASSPVTASCQFFSGLFCFHCYITFLHQLFLLVSQRIPWAVPRLLSCSRSTALWISKVRRCLYECPASLF